MKKSATKKQTVHVTRGKKRLFCGRRIGQHLTDLTGRKFICPECVAALLGRHNQYADLLRLMAGRMDLQGGELIAANRTIANYEQVFSLIGSAGVTDEIVEDEPAPGVVDVHLPGDDDEGKA